MTPAARPATLIYNAAGGSTYRAPLDDVLRALHDAGYAPRHIPTPRKADVAAALHGVTGPVFVAGGDGTFRAAALAVLGRADVTLGLIPAGTSNNIAGTLGLRGDPLAVVQAYAHATPAPFDAGRVRGPWGTDVFFEACGCGVFAEVLHAYDPAAPKSPLRAAQALLDILPTFTPTDLDVTVDGRFLDGPPLALLEVMNIRSTGNALRLAPHAHPDDGRLNLIRVNGEQRDSLLAYVAALLRGQFPALPSVTEDLLTTVHIPYVGQTFHVDDETRPGPAPGSPVPGSPVPGSPVDDSTVPGSTVEVTVWPGALSVLRPRP